MTDPFLVLELPPDADDAAIRARYLELVRRRPPEQAPERFAAVRIDFRIWLEELAAGEPGASATGVLHPPVTDVPGSPAVDLATLVAAFTALRHEVNLQTKATRA